jgi:hypothetical protein
MNTMDGRRFQSGSEVLMTYVPGYERPSSGIASELEAIARADAVRASESLLASLKSELDRLDLPRATRS